MDNLADNGMVHLPSPYPVTETLNRLETILAGKGLTIFARIDHGGAAAKVGLTMPPAEVLIFGNAKAGTPLMVAAPTAAIDLPFKALAWEDNEGKTRLSYNSVEYLGRRHEIPAELLANLAGLPSLLEEAVRHPSQ